MSRPQTSSGRMSAMESFPGQNPSFHSYGGSMATSASDLGYSPNNLSRQTTNETEYGSQAHETPKLTSPGTQMPIASPAADQAGGDSAPSTSLSGLVCNVHRTTGKEPHALVGATTTILGDTLYVFGGRILSRTKPQLTSDMYELDLVRRHWSKVQTKGDVPPPRYFHSVCPLGDSKLVCYGGMSPAILPSGQPTAGTAQDSQPEVVVMSDIYVYDVPTRTWTFVNTSDPPQGRYAHCATILPSSASFASSNAPSSALHHNPTSPSGNPNQGSLGVTIDGTGGAEMVVVGGQDSGNHYIEQISVFNLRSLKWTSTDPLEKSCGAYRSVVAPLADMSLSDIGKGDQAASDSRTGDRRGSDAGPEGSSMLIYSNYNFLDVKLELQIRSPDGRLTEKPMQGSFSPPGLRFPNGGVIDHHFVVAGTYLTSSKQEYALWALDLRTLIWSRIDAGGNHFSQGSWNRGVLWKRRNMFVILGNKKRSLVEDYNHRRINFSNLCIVELEAFGLYDNPRKTNPSSRSVSASAPPITVAPSLDSYGLVSGLRPLLSAAEELGKSAMAIRELSDMDLLAMGGERIPVNSRVLARRWGPYFISLMNESAFGQDSPEVTSLQRQAQTRPGGQSRNSSITITPSIGATSLSSGATLTNSSYANSVATARAGNHIASNNVHGEDEEEYHSPEDLPTTRSHPPSIRSRTLYLPHTHFTLQTLVHYFYNASLPPAHHPLSTPQILCSLLQLARPYQIDGLLEAVIEGLHQVLDGRNAAAVFNAAAMAAGGGEGINKISTTDQEQLDKLASDARATAAEADSRNIGAAAAAANNIDLLAGTDDADDVDDLATTVRRNLRLTTASFAPEDLNNAGVASPDTSIDSDADYDTSDAGDTSTDIEGQSNASTNLASADASTADTSSDEDTTRRQRRRKKSSAQSDREVWSGSISSVVGLQKRGLRGLMEGRRMRERGRSQGGQGGVGLGIA